MSKKSFTISLVVLLATIGLVALIAKRGSPVVVQTNLEKIPMNIAGYSATEDAFPDYVYEALNADQHIYRHYKGVDGREIDLYIGYYGTAKGGRTGHNPHGCLPGAGWVILKTHKIRVIPSYYPDGVDLNYILTRKGDAFICLIHWYQSAGKKVLSTGFEQNIERFKGRILHNRNDGAFIEVYTLTTKNEIEEAKLLVRNFSEKLLDLLPGYWPVEE